MSSLVVGSVLSSLMVLSPVLGNVINVLDQGLVADIETIDVCTHNTATLNTTLAAMTSGDILLFPSGYDFWFNGGIYASGLTGITIQVDGTINFQDERKYWPTDSNGRVLECIRMENMNDLTFTSSNDRSEKGLIFGNGQRWWGAVEYLVMGENRPRLLHVYNSAGIQIENMYFKDSPYWTVDLQDVKDVEIGWSNVSARREPYLDYHDLYDLTAFNTDGFDVSGENIWIHDCEIWNDDDCIAVKSQNGNSHQSDCSANMLFERINASGVGLTIGSIGGSSAHNCVRNITFRNSYMYHTYKGIYVKSNPSQGTGEITQVLYENITMIEPTQWAIWIGPQQAVYSDACDLDWPEAPWSDCPVPADIDWSDITLRNVYIDSPRMSPGTIYGNDSNPMNAIVFDNVVVTNPGSHPWGNNYYWCENVVNSYSKGGTSPKPSCFD